VNFRGTVKNATRKASGTKVEISTVPKGSSNDLTDMLLSISKKVRGLPRDFAAQLDHYVYGTSKK
jgi:hypothetical protein